MQQAQLVRRLRLLEMPVPDIRAVLAAENENARDAAIAQHLQRMEETLGRTTQVVVSLGRFRRLASSRYWRIDGPVPMATSHGDDVRGVAR